MRITCFEPILNNESEILILGTMPGTESLLQDEYYASESNHFWDFIFRIFDTRWGPYDVVDESITYKEKKSFLLKNKLALWDVIESCERDGSSDNKIKNEIINDFEAFFNKCDFNKVIFNGKKAAKLFKLKYKGLLTRAEFILTPG